MAAIRRSNIDQLKPGFNSSSFSTVFNLFAPPRSEIKDNMQLPTLFRLAALAGLASTAVLPRTDTTDIQFCTASTYATGACPYAQPTAGAGTCGTLTVEANVCCKSSQALDSCYQAKLTPNDARRQTPLTNSQRPQPTSSEM